MYAISHRFSERLIPKLIARIIQKFGRCHWSAVVNVCGPWALEAMMKSTGTWHKSSALSSTDTLRGSHTCWAHPWPQARHLLQTTESCVPGLNDTAPHVLLHMVVVHAEQSSRRQNTRQVLTAWPSTLWGLPRHWGGSLLQKELHFFAWTTVSLWSYAHCKSHKRFFVELLKSPVRFLPWVILIALLQQDIYKCSRNKECSSTLFVSLGESYIYTHKCIGQKS